MGLLKVEINSNRVYGLDILRALAILFVVYGHTIPYLIKIWPYRWLTFPVLDGVSIFFVLSGFLIGGILIKTLEQKEANAPVLLHFWIRRWFRTLPNYFLILLLLFIGQGLVLGKTSFSETWSYLFFVQNFNDVHPLFFPEAWSLSIEEWFYILLPLSLFAMVRMKVPVKKSLIIAAVLILAFSFTVRYLRFMEMESISFKTWDNVFRKQVVTRLDSLMFGVIGAWFSFYFVEQFKKNKKLLFFLGLLLMLLTKALLYYRVDFGFDYNLYYCVFSFTLMSISTLLLLPYLSHFKKGSGRVFRMFTIISLISYSMYLINLTVVQEVILRALYKVIPLETSSFIRVVYFVFMWIIAIVGSLILYKYFEMPMTKLRDKVSLERIQNWFTKSR